MARKKLKWKCLFIFYLLSLNFFTNSLPITERSVYKSEIAADSIIVEEAYGKIEVTTQEQVIVVNELPTEAIVQETAEIVPNITLTRNEPVRPGQTVTSYSVEITPNGGTFSGRAIINVELETATREDPIVLHAEDLNIQSVSYGIYSLLNPLAADFSVDEGLLEITPPNVASSFILLILYTGTIRSDGTGLYQGTYDSSTYLAMNLYPINARKVFPCMDELTMESTISFTFNNIAHNFITGNSVIESSGDGTHVFSALQGPTHRWGMVAHSLNNVNTPIRNSRFYMRAGLTGQENQASILLNGVFYAFEEWTSKLYSEIHNGQNEVLSILALPDTTKEWHALSTVAVWEPYILMPTTLYSLEHRKKVMTSITEAITGQWFGYVVFPENWRYQWINTGMQVHSAYEMLRTFSNTLLDATTDIDMDTIFVTDVIQEGLFQDGYANSQALELSQDIFDPNEIRMYINGIIKTKAPAIIWLLKSVLGQTTFDSSVDHVQAAARALLNSRSLQSFNSLNFYDALSSDWNAANNPHIDDIQEFLETWVDMPHYPVINVQFRSSGVSITQETFGYSNVDQLRYQVPVTYTTSVNPNFDDTTVTMLDNNILLQMFFDEEDWIICNLRGQGYYRVNYDSELWERIIISLEDPDRRATIHPLNRATLIDDALNLARAGRLDYDTALRVVLTMEHETEYAPWKAFVRNMDFIRLRLTAMILNDEDLDEQIYTRMVSRTIGAVENALGFYPDPLIIESAMDSLTRGLVMDHACRANYQPCVAAAIDWFYNPADPTSVNPDIPRDIRPAVYCTMMREGDQAARDALWAAYESEVVHYERLVIIKALGCSSDQTFLQNTLNEFVFGTTSFVAQERVEFMKSIIESSYENAEFAIRFMRSQTFMVTDIFGGSDQFEEIIKLLSLHAPDFNHVDLMEIWVSTMWNDSEMLANSVLANARENLLWNDIYMNAVYEWIDENDAATSFVSLSLLLMCILFSLFNH